jgi:hypothetical protein
VNLTRGNQIRERMDQFPFDRTLQMPRAVLHIGALAQQERPCSTRHIENEWSGIGRVKDALLQQIQLDTQDPAEFLGTQRSEYNNFVDPIHELRRKLSPCRFHSCPGYFGIQVFITLT